MTSALIGTTGFVGGNLKQQFAFDDHYRSTDIDSIRGKRYSLIVCAGTAAAKWLANQDPAADRAALQKLLEPLGEVEAERFVLLSTVDVYQRPIEVDEAAPADAAHAYGLNRRLLEKFVAQRFARSTIVRLPGLFGPGLKKNLIYDLLHQHQVEKINPAGIFQYYNLAHLWRDLERAEEKGIALLNLATEPVSTGEVALRCFGRTLPELSQPAARYQVRSLHAEAFGGKGGYLYDRESVLAELEEFVREAR